MKIGSDVVRIGLMVGSGSAWPASRARQARYDNAGAPVIDHVYISVTDVARSLAFYAVALKPLGWREQGNYDSTGARRMFPTFMGSVTPRTVLATRSAPPAGTR